MCHVLYYEIISHILAYIEIVWSVVGHYTIAQNGSKYWPVKVLTFALKPIFGPVLGHFSGVGCCFISEHNCTVCVAVYGGLMGPVVLL